MILEIKNQSISANENIYFSFRAPLGAKANKNFHKGERYNIDPTLNFMNLCSKTNLHLKLAQKLVSTVEDINQAPRSYSFFILLSSKELFIFHSQ